MLILYIMFNIMKILNWRCEKWHVFSQSDYVVWLKFEHIWRHSGKGKARIPKWRHIVWNIIDHKWIINLQYWVRVDGNIMGKQTARTHSSTIQHPWCLLYDAIYIYICVCVCVCIYIYVCVCVCVHVYMVSIFKSWSFHIKLLLDILVFIKAFYFQLSTK